MPRSTLLRLATATAFLCLSTPPASAFVDEAYATRVYELANRSVRFKIKLNKMIYASAYFGYQGWFGI
jgi:hypothetical protein